MYSGICDEDTNFGERVRCYRKMRNVTQEGLAKAVGVSRSVIGKLERDNIMPSAETAMKIAKRLDIPLVYMLKCTGSPVIIVRCFAGKTMVNEDGFWKENIDYVSLCCNIDFPERECFCIQIDDRVYLVRSSAVSETGSDSVYYNDDMIVNSGTASDDSCIIGVVVCDVTEFIM